MENSTPHSFVKAAIITGISLVLGLCFDYFFFDRNPGLNFPLYAGLVVAGLFIIASYFKRPLENNTLLLLIPFAFFSVMVFVRSSGMLTFLNIGACILLLLLIARISFAKALKSFLVSDYIKTFFLPFKFFRPLFRTISDLISLRGINRDKKVTEQVIKGIIITVPVLFVFLLLFSSADLIFQKYLLDIVNINIKEETIARIILVTIATIVFIGAYSYLFNKTATESSEETIKSPTIGRIEISILLASVNVLFFAFILVQLAYLFGGEQTILEQGFTYAQYARHGFFELIAVAVISFFLVFGAEKFSIKKDAHHSVGFKILSNAVIVQVIVIMVSAFKRLSLYEASYGFTTMRFYSHAFIIFLGVIFCILAYKIIKNAQENLLAFNIFAVVVLFLGTMNILNPDAFIAQKNVERYAVTGKLDPVYMSYMSADALPVSISILGMTESAEKNEFARLLYSNANSKYSYEFKPTTDWQSLNISRLNAQKILQARMQELEQYKYYMSTQSGSLDAF